MGKPNNLTAVTVAALASRRIRRKILRSLEHLGDETAVASPNPIDRLLLGLRPDPRYTILASMNDALVLLT